MDKLMATQGEAYAEASSDPELLHRWGEGDRAAGNQLFERHLPSVYRFFRTKVSADIDDLVQRTFLACVEARARYQHRSSFKTFLLSIARNQLYKYYRDHKRNADKFDASVTSIRDLGTTPTDAIVGRQQEQLLLEALQDLPLETQVMVELVYWEELAIDELAIVLDLPTNTVYSRMSRARRQLRERLTTISSGVPDDWRVSFEELEGWARGIANSAAD